METPQAHVNVVLPVFNAARYLESAVRSVLQQRGLHFNLIAVNDGSTDGSGDVLRSIAEADPRVRVIDRENRGLVASLNEALEVSSAPYIARMDADDICEQDRFAKQLSFLVDHPEVVAVGSQVTLIDEDGDLVGPFDRPLLHTEIDSANLTGDRGSRITHPAAMLRRSAVLQVGGYRPETFPAEDLDLFLRLAEIGRLANLDIPLLRYRVVSTSICRQMPAEQRQAIQSVVRDACHRRGLTPPNFPTAPPKTEARSRGHGIRHLSKTAMRNGISQTARKHARRALLAEPFVYDSWRVVCYAYLGESISKRLGKMRRKTMTGDYATASEGVS